jgi:hypothetical protein
VAEGGHEYPQRGGIEQPVGRGPSHRPAGQGPVLHQDREPLGQLLDQGGGALGVEEADPARHTTDDPAGPLLSPGQEVEEPTERPEQDHADPRGHDDQDRCRLRLATGVAGRDVEPVRDEKGHQGEPEHHVEHDRRSDALGAEGEPGIGTAHTRLGEESVPEGRPGGRPSGRDVAQGQRGHIDAEQAEPAGAVTREDRVGQLGVGHQSADLEQDAEHQIADVDMGQRVDLGPMAGQQGQRDIEDEQEDQQGPDAQAHLPPDERSPVPPPPP